MKNENHSGAGVAVAALATGSLIGLAAGILYAPKSGQETRRGLNNKYNEARSRLRYKSGQVKDALKKKSEDDIDLSDQSDTDSDEKPENRVM